MKHNGICVYIKYELDVFGGLALGRRGEFFCVCVKGVYFFSKSVTKFANLTPPIKSIQN